MEGVGVAGVFAEVCEVIEAAGPAGILVDFLKGDDVGVEADEEGGDAAEVGLHGAPGLEALDGAQAATVRDVEGNEAEPVHRRGECRRKAGGTKGGKRWRGDASGDVAMRAGGAGHGGGGGG